MTDAFDAAETSAPLYLRLARLIEDDILRDTLRPGDPIPSSTSMSREHTINPATVGRAFHHLVHSGIIVKRRGIGMFVATDARERIQSRRRGAFFTETLKSVGREAELLNIDPSELTAHIAAVLAPRDGHST